MFLKYADQGKLRKTFAYYAAFVILGLVAAVLGPTLPDLASNVRTTISQISYLFVLRSLGYLVGSFIAGRVYDLTKGHPVLVLVILVLAVLVVLVPVIHVLWLLSALLFLIGIFEGVLDVGGNTLLVWVHKEKMGPYMNGLHFFFGLGAFISPIIIAQTVLITGDISWAYWSLALLMLPSAFWLSRLPSPSHVIATESRPLRPILPQLVALLAFFNFMYVGAEVSFGGWIFTYATTSGLGSSASAAYLTSAFWGAMTAGRLASIPLASRFSPKTILFYDLCILMASIVLMIVFPGSLIFLWIGTIGAGLGMASMFPTVLSLAERYMTITGSVTSWFFVGSSLGGMALPWVIGQLFVPMGPQAIIFTIGLGIIIDMLLFSMIVVLTRKIEKEQGLVPVIIQKVIQS